MFIFSGFLIVSVSPEWEAKRCTFSYPFVVLIIKQAAKMNIPEVKTIFNDLKIRFGKATTTPSEKPRLESQRKSLPCFATKTYQEITLPTAALIKYVGEDLLKPRLILETSNAGEQLLGQVLR